MSVTITLHLWWVGAYFAVGALIWLPLEGLAYRQLAKPRSPFWRTIRRQWRRIPLAIAGWPLGIWEVLR